MRYKRRLPALNGCEQCGDALVTCDEQIEMLCERCQLRRDWATMRPLFYQPGVRQAMQKRAQALQAKGA